MKTVYIYIILLVAFAKAEAQNWNREIAFGYNYVSPTGGMKHHISRGHGINIDYLISPGQDRWSFGLSFDAVMYGHQRTTQEYSFPDGTLADMDIVVNNSYVNIMLMSRYYLADYQVLRPYVIGKLGYTGYKTNLSIYDPDDNDQCEPVESEILKHDGTILATAGTGIQYDLAHFFKRFTKNHILLDIGINYSQGGRVDYMNVDAPMMHHSGANKDVEAAFINTQTQVVHKHHVGYLYSNFAQMMEMKAKLVIKLLN